MQADLAKIVPLLTIMRNQGPNSVNGGGASILTAQGPFTATNPASNSAPDLSSQQAPVDAQIRALQDCLNGSNSTTCGAAPNGPLTTTAAAPTDQPNVVSETPVAVSQEPTQVASNGPSSNESATAQGTADQQRQIADAAVTELEAKVQAPTGLVSQWAATAGTPRNAGFDNPADEVTSPASGNHANDDGLATIAAGKRDQPDAATGLGAATGGHPGCDDRSGYG